MKDEEIDNVLLSLNPDASSCCICKRWYNEKIQEQTIKLYDFCMVCWYQRNALKFMFEKIMARFGKRKIEELYFNRYTVTINDSQVIFQLKEKGE